MKIARETSKFLIAFCPAHNDQHTPNFYINKTEINGRKKGYAYCFSCGHTAQYSEEWVDSMSKKKTRIRASDKRKRQPINWYNLASKYAGWLTTMPINLTWKTGTKYLIGWDKEAWTIPMRNENIEIVGIHRRFPDGYKCCIEDSELGIFIPGAISYKDSKKVVITEGWSDAAVATECDFYGIGLACAITTHDTIVKFLVNHAVDTVVIVADNDEPGKKSAMNLSGMLRTKLIDNRIIIPEPYKDLREKYENDGQTSVTGFLERGQIINLLKDKQ